MLAVHLLASSKKGISAHQLHRNLGISYKAAWFMAHRLRYAMASGPLAELLKGVVEADETYVGGKQKGPFSTARRYQNKTAVMGLVERRGRLRLFPLKSTHTTLMNDILAQHVDKSADMITDDRAYQGLRRTFKSHKSVIHSRGEYVRGETHTNTIEGVFSLLKRGITGTFHHVSKGHLHRYCSEFEFRYNTRVRLGYTDGERASLLVRGAEGKRLTYKQPSDSRTA